MFKYASPVLFLLLSLPCAAASLDSFWNAPYAAHPLKHPHQKERTVGTKYFQIATYAVTDALARFSDFAVTRNSQQEYSLLMDFAADFALDWKASGLLGLRGLIDETLPLAQSIGFLLAGEARGRFPTYSRASDRAEMRTAQTARARLVLAWRLNRLMTVISGQQQNSLQTLVRNLPKVHQWISQGSAACAFVPTAFCRAAPDVIALVNPEQSPAGDQLEGGARSLAETAFEDFSRQGPIFRELARLRNAKASQWKTLHMLSKRTFEERLALIRARALASHNHGVETYLVLLSAWNAKSAEHAVEIAETALLSLQRLYQVGPVRDASDGSLQIPTGSERSYHFWGGAWVAAELRARGHSREVARDWSARLGMAYEVLTLKGEAWAGSSADAELHRIGAEWAIQ